MARGIAEFSRARDEVVHLSERFDRNTPDVVWIRALQGEGWIIVSGDTRISRNPAERAAWHESGLTAFFLDDSWARRKYWIQVRELVHWWPTICDRANQCEEGSGYLLPFKGAKPRLIYTP